MKNKINILVGMAMMFNTGIAMAQTVASAKIEGSPYLSESYVDAEVRFDKGNPATVPLRYNVYQDFMEYKQNGQPFALDNTKVKKIKMGDQIYVFGKFEFKGKATKGFLTVLDSGKAMLFAKQVVTFLDAKPGRAMDGTDAPARYTKQPDVYFYKVGEGELKPVENIKELIASFPDKQDELKVFAKEEKISPRNKKELIKFFQYYNSLP